MVNVILIERVLNDIRSHLNDLRAAEDITWERYRTDIRARRFVERTLHILIEACIDVAQHLISDENMREPNSYQDAFVVLAEHGVVHSTDLPRLQAMASLRNLIVHYYEKIDDAMVFGIFKQRLGDFDIFVDRIADYLLKHAQS